MSTGSIVVPAAASFVVCLALTPLLRDLAAKLGWVDRPDRDRKLHAVPVPRIGGVPVVVACMASLAVFYFWESQNGSDFDETFALAVRLLPASLLVFVTGILDDLIGLRPVQKLCGQSLAAALVCLAGLRLDVGNGETWGEVAGIMITFAWLVACSNAFNLIDGVDGLATGLGVIATLTMFVAACLWGDTGIAILSAAMIGSLLGFLCFNFNPASIFLGDSGSLWTGFMLGCFGVVWLEKLPQGPSMIAPILVLAIPLADTALSITRRFVSKRPVFSGDHSHIHHRLLGRWPVHRRVALVLYGVAAFVSTIALALSVASRPIGYILAGLFLAWACIAVRKLAYDEFRILFELLGKLRLIVSHRMSLVAMEKQLRDAASPETCWFILARTCREFGFSGVTLHLSGYHFTQPSAANDRETWTLRIPLTGSEYLALTRPAGSATAVDTLPFLADVLHRELSRKALGFREARKTGARILVVRGGEGAYRNEARAGNSRPIADVSGRVSV